MNAAGVAWCLQEMAKRGRVTGVAELQYSYDTMFLDGVLVKNRDDAMRPECIQLFVDNLSQPNRKPKECVMCLELKNQGFAMKPRNLEPYAYLNRHIEEQHTCGFPVICYVCGVMPSPDVPLFVLPIPASCGQCKMLGNTENKIVMRALISAFPGKTGEFTTTVSYGGLALNFAAFNEMSALRFIDKLSDELVNEMNAMKISECDFELNMIYLNGLSSSIEDACQLQAHAGSVPQDEWPVIIQKSQEGKHRIGIKIGKAQGSAHNRYQFIKGSVVKMYKAGMKNLLALIPVKKGTLSSDTSHHVINAANERLAQMAFVLGVLRVKGTITLHKCTTETPFIMGEDAMARNYTEDITRVLLMLAHKMHRSGLPAHLLPLSDDRQIAILTNIDSSSAKAYMSDHHVIKSIQNAIQQGNKAQAHAIFAANTNPIIIDDSSKVKTASLSFGGHTTTWNFEDLDTVMEAAPNEELEEFEELEEDNDEEEEDCSYPPPNPTWNHGPSAQIEQGSLTSRVLVSRTPPPRGMVHVAPGTALVAAQQQETPHHSAAVPMTPSTHNADVTPSSDGPPPKKPKTIREFFLPSQ